MRHTLELLIALFIALPSGVRAQHGPEKCGVAPYPEDDVASLTDWFTSPEQAGFRAEQGFQTLDVTAPIELLVDDHLCGTLLNEALKQLRALDQMGLFRPNGLQHRLYRVGPYYAAVISQAPPKRLDKNASFDLGPDLVLFFDGGTMAFLREVLR